MNGLARPSGTRQGRAERYRRFIARVRRKASRGEDADVHELSAPKKQTAARMQPARKSTAKKTSARKPRRSA